jgi:hypothetical protein
VAHTPRRVEIGACQCPDWNRAWVRHELEVRDDADEWARRGSDTERRATMSARQREKGRARGLGCWATCLAGPLDRGNQARPA